MTGLKTFLERSPLDLEQKQNKIHFYCFTRIASYSTVLQYKVLSICYMFLLCSRKTFNLPFFQATISKNRIHFYNLELNRMD